MRRPRGRACTAPDRAACGPVFPDKGRYLTGSTHDFAEAMSFSAETVYR